MAVRSLEELTRDVESLYRYREADREDITNLQLWKAEVRGSLKTLTWLVGIGLGLPAATVGILTVLIIAGVIGRSSG